MLKVNQRYQEAYLESTLDNGLKVVLWQKKDYAKSFFMMATPLGSFDLVQASEDETYHYPAGIAHFLEHKMFEGANGEDLSETFSNYSAHVNAYTSFNETTYYFHTTQDIYKPLELLLDLVQNLNITKESVEKEKSIIIQELNMYMKMSDSKLLYELLKSLYHKHPMRYEILGDEASIQAITYEDLQKAYTLNYHPSKMILVGICNQDVHEVLAFIKENQAKKTFAPIQNVHRIIEQEAKEVYRPYYETTMDVNTKKVACSFKLSGISNQKERLKKEWAIKFLIDTYFTTLNPDYQTWIDEEIFKDYLGGEIDYGSHHGFLSFYGESDDEQRFANLIEEQMKVACEKGIDESILNQLKRRYFAEGVRSFQHFEDIAQITYRAYFDNYDYFLSLDLFDEISCEYIKEVASSLDLTHKTITVIKGV